MINRRQILKATISTLAWLPLLLIKKETFGVFPRVLNYSGARIAGRIAGQKVYNTLPKTDLPRKIVHFPSLFRNGGEVGHESFITEWHIGGNVSRISNVKFINTEIHFNNTHSKATILDCEFKNVYTLIDHPNNATIILKTKGTY